MESQPASEIPREILEAYDATNCVVVNYQRKRRWSPIRVSITDTNGLFFAEKRAWRRSKALEFIDEQLDLYDDLFQANR